MAANIKDLINQGQQLKQDGKFAEAIAAYEAVIQLQPNSESLPEIYLDLGLAQIQLGNSEAAITCLVKVLRIKPDCSAFFLAEKIRKLWWQLGSWLLTMSHEQKTSLQTAIENAIKILAPPIQEELKIKTINFTEVFQLKLNYLAWLYTSLGRILTQQNKITEAIVCNQQALFYQITLVKPKFSDSNNVKSEPKNPDFLIIGVLKCGTSSLYKYLTQHPKIVPALQKELYYFNRSSQTGEIYWNWYLSNFISTSNNDSFLTGEATPTYISYQGTAQKVFDSLPNIKLIVLLRNPVARIISQYFYNVNRGVEKRPLAEVIAWETAILQDVTTVADIYQACAISSPQQKWDQWYLPHSLYVYFLEKWLGLFPQNQCLILQTEILSQNPAMTTNLAFDFLGLPPCETIKYKKYNQGKYSQGNLEPNLSSKLANFFQPHNQKLEQYLDRKFNWNLSF